MVTARTHRLVSAAGVFISRGICPERLGRRAYGKLEVEISGLYYNVSELKFLY